MVVLSNIDKNLPTYKPIFISAIYRNWSWICDLLLHLQYKWVCCASKNNIQHIPRGESAIHDREIVSTTVEMFWEEINTFSFAFIANICREKEKISLKLKKLQRE